MLFLLLKVIRFENHRCDIGDITKCTLFCKLFPTVVYISRLFWDVARCAMSHSGFLGLLCSRGTTEIWRTNREQVDITKDSDVTGHRLHRSYWSGCYWVFRCNSCVTSRSGTVIELGHWLFKQPFGMEIFHSRFSEIPVQLEILPILLNLPASLPYPAKIKSALKFYIQFLILKFYFILE